MFFRDSSIRLWILILFMALCQITHSQGTIHDAVFSPDGSMIAVGGTKGVYLYWFDSMELIDAIQTPNDVHFIRWSPDLLYLFVAQWDESITDSKVTYSMIDINSHSILYDITDTIRWVGRLIIFNNVERNIEIYDRPLRDISHPNTMGFSTLGRNIAYIDMNNQIVIRDVLTGQLVKILNPIQTPVISSEITLSAVGYISEDEMYACTYYGGNYSIQNDQFIEKSLPIDPIYRNYLTPQQSFFVSSEWKTVFTLGPVNILDMSFSSPILNTLYILSNISSPDTPKYTLSSYTGSRMYNATQRAFYIPKDETTIVLNHSREDKSFILQITDSLTITVIDNFWKPKYYYTIGYDRYSSSIGFDTLLLQPFSPDGESFLLLQKRELYLFKSKNFENRIILPKPSSILDFMVMSEN